MSQISSRLACIKSLIAYYRQTNLLNRATDRNSDSLLGTFVTMYTKIPFTDNVIRPTDIMSSMKLNTIIFYPSNIDRYLLICYISTPIFIILNELIIPKSVPRILGVRIRGFWLPKSFLLCTISEGFWVSKSVDSDTQNPLRRLRNNKFIQDYENRCANVADQQISINIWW